MALDALMVVSNPRKKHRRFSPAQKRAQALFAKRAKSGTWRKNTKLSSSARSELGRRQGAVKHYRVSSKGPAPYGSWGKGSGTSGKVSQSSVERSGRRKVSPRGWTKSDMLKRYGSRADYRKNTKLSASRKRSIGWPTHKGKGWRGPLQWYGKGTGTFGKVSKRARVTHKGWGVRSAHRYRKNARGWSPGTVRTGKVSTTSHFIGAKLRRKTKKTNPKRKQIMARRRNRFPKGRKSSKARRIAQKFWRSAKGRKFRAARKAGHSMKAAWRLARGGKTRRKARRSSPKRHRKSIKHVRAGRIGAARKKARKGGMTSGFFLNPRRRRSKVRRRRHSRRTVVHHRRRRSHSRRRNTYVVANRRHYRRRSRRRNGPYFGIFTNKRRGRRRNMGGMINTLKPALFALGGFAAVRLIPSLIARVAPGVLGSVASAAGGWADVAVSGGALALLYYFGGRVPAVGGILSNPNLILGATISVVMDIALKVLPPNILGMIGLAPTAPALAGWSPGERTGAISGYVQTPVLGGYVQTPMLGAYVEAGGMGLDVRKALMGLGAEVTSGPCPGCTQLPANMAALPLGAQMRAKGFFGTRGYPIPTEQGAIAVPGIFRGSIFGG